MLYSDGLDGWFEGLGFVLFVCVVCVLRLGYGWYVMVSLGLCDVLELCV